MHIEHRLIDAFGWKIRKNNQNLYIYWFNECENVGDFFHCMTYVIIIGKIAIKFFSSSSPPCLSLVLFCATVVD